jgi:predicted  nucleic acid-binding Zn-ribbon protein
MNYKKINQIENRISQNRKKLSEEKDPKKKQIKQLRIEIDVIRTKLERLKD